MIRRIAGTIELADGSRTSFSLSPGVGYQQWGNTEANLWETVEVLQGMVEAAAEYMSVDEEEHA